MPLSPAEVESIGGNRRRDQFKILERSGYKTLDQVLNLIAQGETYVSYYDIEAKLERGYSKTLSFPVRTKMLRNFAMHYFKVLNLDPNEVGKGLSPNLDSNGYPKTERKSLTWLKVRGAVTPQGIPLGLDQKIPGPRCFTSTKNGVILGWIRQLHGQNALQDKSFPDEDDD
jgi:hypothetical protein